jgi:hypothetical protein
MRAQPPFWQRRRSADQTPADSRWLQLHISDALGEECAICWERRRLRLMLMLPPLPLSPTLGCRDAVAPALL